MTGLCAITIRPPWSQIIAESAALTALGVAPKQVENRGRPIHDRYIGADIAIHAGRTWCPVGGADLRVRRAWRVFADAIGLRQPNPLLAAIGDTRTGYVGKLQPTDGLWLTCGAVVAVATLTDCHPAVEGDQPGTACCPPWGESTHNGRPAYHLSLGNARRLPEPVPAKGRLSMPWTLPEPVASAVRAQLPERVTVR